MAQLPCMRTRMRSGPIIVRMPDLSRRSGFSRNACVLRNNLLSVICLADMHQALCARRIMGDVAHARYADRRFCTIYRVSSFLAINTGALIRQLSASHNFTGLAVSHLLLSSFWATPHVVRQTGILQVIKTTSRMISRLEVFLYA